ncbi:MAG: hypothetical protein WEI16_00490 [Chloroflexota bacterium]
MPRPFDGYPYLVTRIGHTDLRNVAILPADWPRQRLIDLARRLAAANQLESCLCLGPADAVYVDPGGAIRADAHLPLGIPVVERLPLAEPIPDSPDVRARRARLATYAAAHTPGGYQVGDGLEGGRRAGPDDIARLSRPRRDRSGVQPPAGLRRCRRCRGLAGEFLAVRGEGNGDPTPRVIGVHCRCDNHNRCARCGRALASDRLSAYTWDEGEGKPWYLAAYAAFSHTCPRRYRSIRT